MMSAPKMPAAPALIPTENMDPIAQQAALLERKRQQAALGFRSTVLTSPGGLLSPPLTMTPALKGQ